MLPHDSHPLKLCFYTRTASVLPYELKIIEILHSLPNNSFQKTESLKYLKSFRVELQNQKGKYHKVFDLFELRQDTSNTFSVLEIIDAPSTLHSIYFCENPDLMSQASVHLATHAVPHTYTNPIQIKVPKGTQIITSSFEFLEHNSLDNIIELLESPCYTNLFVFKAIAASHSSLPEHSQVNFLKITRLDPEPLITLFTQANIHYLLFTHFLLFQASPIQIGRGCEGEYFFDDALMRFYCFHLWLILTQESEVQILEKIWSPKEITSGPNILPLNLKFMKGSLSSQEYLGINFVIRFFNRNLFGNRNKGGRNADIKFLS